RAGAREPGLEEELLAERHGFRLARHAVRGIGRERRRPRTVAQDLRDLVLREIDCAHLIGGNEAIGGAAGRHLERELPLPRHVEHQAVGAPVSGAERLHRRRVIHAVAVLWHLRIDFERLRLRLPGLRTSRYVDREVPGDLDGFSFESKKIARRLQPGRVARNRAGPSREAQYGCSKEAKTCSPFFHAMRSATSRGRSASQRRDQSAWPWM